MPGTEITCSILGEEALPLLEIRPKSGLYDYFHKYQKGSSKYLVPAPLEEEVAEAISKAGETSFRSLGCRVYARIDFRLDSDGRYYFLEANTLPGMTASSLVPKSAAAAGIDYNELIERILMLSLRDDD